MTHHFRSRSTLPVVDLSPALNMSGLAPLAGMVIAVKGIDFTLFRNKADVEDFARDAGAKVMKNLSKSVTHMVVANGSVTGTSQRMGVSVVDESWLRSHVLAYDPSQPLAQAHEFSFLHGRFPNKQRLHQALEE